MTRILIVDDHEPNREFLVALLRGNGFEVDTARHGAEALMRARKQAPDLIVSDLLMPVMDGYMLLRHLRTDDRLAAVAFLVYTGTYTEPKDEQLAFDLGADAFMIKPAEPEVMLAAVRDLLLRVPVLAELRAARVGCDPRTVLETYAVRIGDKLQRKLFELEQTRQVLRGADHLYSSLFENNHAVMLLIDPEAGAIVDANPAACRFYGWSREALRRMRITDINCLSEAQVTVEMERARAENRSGLLFRHRLADGAVREVEVYSGPIQVGGRPLEYSIIHDVSERLETKRQLERSERLTEIAATLAQVGGWEIDPAGDRVDWSEEVRRIVGLPHGATLTVEEAVGFFLPEWRDDMRQALAGCAEDGTSFDKEVPIQTVDGRRVWVRILGAAVRDGLGSIVAVHGALQDISGRVAAEEQLRQLALAVEQSSESVVITDLEPRIQYVNEAFCRVSGFTRAELIGQDPRVLKSGKTPRATYQSMWGALTAGQPWRGEFYNRRTDGSEYVELASVSPVRQADGRVTHYLGVKEDITDKRRVAEELEHYRQHLEEMVVQRTADLVEAQQIAEHANQAKSAFLANMSHEIRTPMNGVLGMVEVLGRDRLSPQQTELVGTIRDSANALLCLIEDILDFSKIEAGKMKLESAPVSIAELVEGLCDSLLPMALGKGVDLNVFVSPAVPDLVLSDDVRLRQILYNLLGNAIKFSSGRRQQRGRVQVRIEVLKASPLHLLFRVADNGVGMDGEVLERLFRPFTQAEESTTRRFGGTGLGLVICKRIVDMMGGEIRVESKTGGGTIFDVILGFEALPGSSAESFPDLSGIVCILLRDEELNADDLADYLEHAGARVQQVDDFDAATNGVRGFSPDGPPLVLISYAERAGSAVPRVLAELAHVRHLHIRRGRRRGARAEAENLVTLDGSALRRRRLLNAVAVAAGRMSPELVFSKTDPPVPDLELPQSPLEATRRRGGLILVAEDDEVNRKVISKQLDLLGWACELAADGAQALAMWRTGSYRLLLTDLHMPEMDGYMLTAAIRGEEADTAERGGDPARLPIVALTANALRGEAERARAAGMDDYLTKPLQLARLSEVLTRWLPPSAPASAQPPAQPVEPADALTVFDVAVLIRLIGKDVSTLQDLLREFTVMARRLLTDFQAALDADNPTQAAGLAHKLKSSSRSVGALALGELCAEIERTGKQGELARLKALSPALAAAIQAAEAKILAALADISSEPR